MLVDKVLPIDLGMLSEFLLFGNSKLISASSGQKVSHKG